MVVEAGEGLRHGEDLLDFCRPSGAMGMLLALVQGFAPLATDRRPSGAVGMLLAWFRGSHPWLPTVAPPGLWGCCWPGSGVRTPGYRPSPLRGCGDVVGLVQGFAPLATDRRPSGAVGMLLAWSR